MSKIQTLGQKRSAFALRIITSKDKGSVKKTFKNFVIGAPSMILQNGFGQTLAFWAAKDEEQHEFVLNAVTKWLKEQDIIESDDYKGLISEISDEFSQREYIYAQKEAVAFLEWMKRYAKAFWKGE